MSAGFRQVALIAIIPYILAMVARRTISSDSSPVLDTDREAARELLSLLRVREERDRFELRGEDGRVATLSGPMVSLLERAARIVSEGGPVDVLARDKELTSQEAAALLGVSRQYLVRLLDRGEIPSSRTGNHRRIRSADMLTYIERRDAGRRAALGAMAAEAQAAGGYGAPVVLGPARRG